MSISIGVVMAAIGRLASFSLYKEIKLKLFTQSYNNSANIKSDNGRMDPTTATIILVVL